MTVRRFTAYALTARTLMAHVARASLAGLVVAALPGALRAEPIQTAAVAKPSQNVQRQTPGTLHIGRSKNDPDTTILAWNGSIFRPMAAQFEAAIGKYKGISKRFLIQLNSPGGSVPEGEKVIALLRDLKETHRVDTLVRAGWTCGSMCPFIFAQGQVRYGAPASTWLFHEISINDTRTGMPKHLDREMWLGLIDEYFVPAGLSPKWLEKMKTLAERSDLYVSGDSLLRHKSGLITKHIPDVLKRNIPNAPEG